ncbi:rod shape-determining protein MreD [Sphingobium sp. B2D3A]|uniref:rod shape-determining protein MreD n=1 Tax=unclassified Sphingobium TaxID=2611147 RepID=UPI0022242793|nr:MULTISPECIES: rod shape-determining protein MreD [unclassified Sphingobium]MCW2337917.1 rod shape-determining protein MreD [Sphingobium sp. B2D3A]MCW2384376.1 rod shape-determining protein MreD [Sphingobium sp. B2D3D]MCW2388065.1 rod shape-determining protein MreD [Sphingobium sp. B11D3B]MCW2394600.1 rod shape-determining protein MreD [Sphingobium sp. B8D3B]MCW2412261.1 rod shape-determining protein MreD [Sphingobium sp. B8D3D]
MNSRYSNRIGRKRTWLHLRGVPVASVILGSMLAPLMPVIAQTPLLPPFGLMMLIAWRVLRPDIWPLWIGVPLGLVDDLMNGQPVGSAVFLWTILLLAFDFEGQRNLWRDYWHGWLLGSLAIGFALAGGWLAVHLSGHGGEIIQILPQFLYSVALFPFIVRICAALDKWRLP